MASPPPKAISISPRLLSTLVITISATTIATSLLLTHFIPDRFQVHPIPYLSDAGLRDPERFILSLGIQLSILCFLPLTISVYLKYTHTLTKLSLIAGITTSLSLTTFTTVPGWWAPHHIFACVFAASAALWCFCYTRMETRNQKLKMALLWSIVLSFTTFAGTWGLIKLRIPYQLVPNKDPRFVVLAIAEYLGTCAFLLFVGIVGSEVRTVKLVLSLRLSKQDLLGV